MRTKAPQQDPAESGGNKHDQLPGQLRRNAFRHKLRFEAGFGSIFGGKVRKASFDNAE